MPCQLENLPIVLNGQSYTSSSNEDTVGFLIDNVTIDSNTTKEITLKSH